jgi:group I intron endonuclease
MNTGIYKWTSPTGRIYVGQSKDLKQRKEWYLSNGIEQASMPKLKRSFKKHGIKNHIFEIIEYCSLEQLNNREIYWGLYYNTLEKGLNCKLGEQNCVFSENTKNKMSKAKKGKSLTQQHQKNKEKSLQKYWDHLKIEREAKKQNKLKYIPTEEHRKNISQSKIGKSIHTESSKQILKEYGILRDLTKVWEAASKSNSKPILQYDIEGNLIKEWKSSNEAEYFYNKKRGDNIRETIRHFNKTGTQWKAYGYIWKEKYR